MAEYLTEALSARANTPEARSRLVQALAASQGRGASLSALSGGRLGRSAQSGPNPFALHATLEQQARQEALQREQMDMKNLQWAANYDLESQKLDVAQQASRNKRLDRDVEALSKRMQKTEKVYTAAKQLQNLFARTEDASGIGFLEGGPGALGKAIRFVQGDEAHFNYGTFRGLINQVLSDDAGTAQTRQEIDNILQRYGATGLEDEDVIRRALPEIIEVFEEERQSIRSGYGPEVNELYDYRMGNEPAQPQTGGGNKVVNFEDL